MGASFSVWAWSSRGLEAGGHAGAAELAEGALQFDEVHVGISSWVFRAMTSR